MSYSPEELQVYLFAAAEDGDRLVIQHNIFKAGFLKILEQVLEQYGLANRLEAARAAKTKLRILDIGCAEGLYLHDVAEVLEARGLLEAAQFNGIDLNVGAISTAEEFCQQSNPPRPYLNFYVHDASMPLEDCLGLRQEGKTEFDFIYLNATLEHLHNARQHLARFYQALKPGGVIYLWDAVTEESEEGWQAPHPLLTPLAHQFNRLIMEANQGLMVCRETAGWLTEMGAEQVQATNLAQPIGGTTPGGRQMLRNSVMMVRNGLPQMVSRGIMSQAQADELMATLHRDLSPASSGYQSWVSTLARKPL